MDIFERADAARRLRDDSAFQNVISEIEAGLSKTLLDARSSDDAVAEARRAVVGLAEIQRKIRAQIDAPKLADNKKGQHRASD